MSQKDENLSDSFCPARFTQLSVHPDMKKNASCCHFGYHEQVFGDDLKVVSKTEQENRIAMLNGVRTSDCTNCWKVESSGGESSRLRWMRLPVNQDLVPGKSEEFYLNYQPKWLNLRLGRQCQLSCLYCSPEYSTQWERVLKNHGPFQDLDMHYPEGSLQFVGADERSQIYSSIIERISQFRHIDMTGGEPLLSPYFSQICSALLASESTEPTEIYIFSGLGVSDEVWEKGLAQLQALSHKPNFKVYIFVSLEALNERAEYIRQGIKFQALEANLLKLRYLPKVQLLFAMSHSCLSVGGFFDFVEWLSIIKKKFRDAGALAPVAKSNFVHAPSFLSFKVLPFALRSRFARDVKAWYQAEEANLSPVEARGFASLLSVIGTDEGEDKRGWENLQTFLRQCDLRFNRDSRLIFPELL